MKKTHSLSIDNFRALAIIAIVVHHMCIGYNPNIHYTIPYLMYANLTKYGSILFMVIAGFLFHKNYLKYSFESFFIRKFKTIVIPAIPFISAWTIILFCADKNKDLNSLVFSIKTCLLYSPYWFIVNLFFIQIINYYVRKVNNLGNFVFFFSLTAFYCINLHKGWVPTSNTNSFFAYFLFFYIGRFVCENFEKISAFCSKVYTSKFKISIGVCLVLVLLILSTYESFLLQVKSRTYEIDVLNILRFSNICFSFSLFLIFYFIRKRLKLNKWFSDRSVFIMYLIHPYFTFLNGIVSKYLWFLSTKSHGLDYIPFELIFTFFVIISCLKFGKMIQENHYLSNILNGNWYVKNRLRRLRTSLYN